MPATLELVKNFLRLRSDETAGKLYLEWLNSATGNWETKEQWDADTGDRDVFGELLVDLVINKATPAVRLIGTETGAADIRIVENAGKYIVQYWDGTAWVDKLRTDAATGNVELIGTIVQDVQLNKVTPAVRLTGTETGAADLSIRENAGVTEVYDNAAAAVVMTLEAHQARHIAGGADEIAGIAYTQLSADTIYFPVPIPIPDSQQAGLAADSLGVKWTSVFKFKLNARHLKLMRIRATWSASATDSVTKVAVIGGTSGEIVNVSGNAGTDAEGEATTGWTDGELIYVQLEVTTASATAGATTDLTYAVVELEYGVS
jgi:hypothetical protein